MRVLVLTELEARCRFEVGLRRGTFAMDRRGKLDRLRHVGSKLMLAFVWVALNAWIDWVCVLFPEALKFFFFF